jgi:hypothetical protein
MENPPSGLQYALNFEAKFRLSQWEAKINSFRLTYTFNRGVATHSPYWAFEFDDQPQPDSISMADQQPILTNGPSVASIKMNCYSKFQHMVFNARKLLHGNRTNYLQRDAFQKGL